MRHVRPTVSTVCVGLAASMGAFILASGQHEKRYSLPNSRLMIHQPLGGAQGQAADIEIQANEILHHKITLNGYLAEFTGQLVEQITMVTDRDFFMSAEEAACRYLYQTERNILLRLQYDMKSKNDFFPDQNVANITQVKNKGILLSIPQKPTHLRTHY